MEIVSLLKDSRIPKYKQIVSSIEDANVSSALKKGNKLPALNAIKKQQTLSRDTVLTTFNFKKINIDV